MKKTGVISGRIMWSAYRFVTQKIGITSKPFVFGTQKWLQYIVRGRLPWKVEVGTKPLMVMWSKNPRCLKLEILKAFSQSLWFAQWLEMKKGCNPEHEPPLRGNLCFSSASFSSIMVPQTLFLCFLNGGHVKTGHTFWLAQHLLKEFLRDV